MTSFEKKNTSSLTAPDVVLVGTFDATHHKKNVKMTFPCPHPLLIHLTNRATLNKEPLLSVVSLNTLRPRQNGRHFPDDIFKCIFLNENVWIPIKISLNFVPKGPINNIPALVQIMAWRHPGDKPISEPMMVSLPTHICITRPQRVNSWNASIYFESWLWVGHYS